MVSKAHGSSHGSGRSRTSRRERMMAKTKTVHTIDEASDDVNNLEAFEKNLEAMMEEFEKTDEPQATTFTDALAFALNI